MTDFASCCVLSYNRPLYLERCLRSLIQNAEYPLELIIHDDGSSGKDRADVLDVLESFADRAKLIRQPEGFNEGQGVALNRMFQMAKGDPIIKLDQDLTFSPGWLAQTVAILKANWPRSQSSGIGVPRAPEEPLIGLLGLLHYHHDPVASLKCKIAQHHGWQSHTHILGSAFAVRRSCWRKLGPFEEYSAAFAEDWDFQRRVTASEGFVCGLPDEDLCVNHGMGIGPSTVVVGPNQVATIHTAPYVIS